MQTKSIISMATIRMDKTTTISATIQQRQQLKNKRKILCHQSCSNNQKQKKNPAPPILFYQPKTKEKSCSTNLVLPPYTVPKVPQLIPTQQEQQRRQ